MSNLDSVIQMLDSMTAAGVSRIKVEVSDAVEEGRAEKAYHHGRCDVGSPFATGRQFVRSSRFPIYTGSGLTVFIAKGLHDI